MPAHPAASFLTWPAIISHGLFLVVLFSLSLFITWTMIHRVGILDTPNSRSSHQSPIPKSGGLAIVAAFTLGSIVSFLLNGQDMVDGITFYGFIASSLTIAAVSFYDDLKNLSFLVRLATQTVAVFVLFMFGLIIDELVLPGLGAVQLGWLAYPFTYLWVVGMTNAFNFMDGLDGLAAGTAAIASLFFAIITISQGNLFVSMAGSTLLVGVLGVLIFNFPPAKIFMGDVGSTFLGFVLAVLAIIAARYDLHHTSFLVMPLLVFNFVFDTTFTLIRRIKAGENITKAHRTHLYQLFNRLGYSHHTVSLSHYGMCMLQGIGAFVMLTMIGNQRLLIFIPYLGIQIVYCRWILARAKKKGLLASSNL